MDVATNSAAKMALSADTPLSEFLGAQFDGVNKNGLTLFFTLSDGTQAEVNSAALRVLDTVRSCVSDKNPYTVISRSQATDMQGLFMDAFAGARKAQWLTEIERHKDPVTVPRSTPPVLLAGLDK